MTAIRQLADRPVRLFRHGQKQRIALQRLGNAFGALDQYIRQFLWSAHFKHGDILHIENTVAM